jgi:L-asparaginase II
VTGAETLVEVWRGSILESVHAGHAVVVDHSGQCVAQWGDPAAIILPRSACKMVQALPLVTSGAADAVGLTPQHLALACSSHNAASAHVTLIQSWLSDLSLSEGDLRCGATPPRDKTLRHAMIHDQIQPDQTHNTCSGKHTGFLTLSRHLNAQTDYLALEHPVQRAVLEAFEAVTDEVSAGHGIDGCSAPTFACSLTGLARAMARFSVADGGDSQSDAMRRLRQAMLAHPDLVAGEGRVCTKLMRACAGRAVVKTGVEGVYLAMLPDRGLGIALKISDGATRAAETTLGALLVKFGALGGGHREARALMATPIYTQAGAIIGHVRPAQTLL